MEAYNHKSNKDTGLAQPIASGTTEELENPVRSDVSNVNVPVRAYSYPAKCTALAKAILRTERALGLEASR